MPESFQRHLLLPCLIAALLATQATRTAGETAEDPNASAKVDANELIVHLHRVALDRKPTEKEIQASRALLGRSAGYETLLIGLIDGQAYRGRERCDAQYVADVFQLTLGRTPTNAEAKTFKAKLTSGTSRLVQAMTLMATAEYKKTRTQRLAGNVEKTNPKGQAPDSKKKDTGQATPKDKTKDHGKKETTPKQKPKAKATSKAKTEPNAKRKPKTPAVTKKDVEAARNQMQAAWRKLVGMMKDRKVALDDPKLQVARQDWFDARRRFHDLRRKLDDRHAKKKPPKKARDKPAHSKEADR